LELYEKIAENPPITCLGHLYTRIGCLHSVGVGVEPNPTKADNYLLLALQYNLSLAAQGDPIALCDLGYMYSFGCGVTKNKETAFNYYLQAAEKGYSRAQFNVAEMYKKGTGVERDPAMAVKYFTLAAQASNMKAQTNLGLMYKRGHGIEKDEEKALFYFRQAAAQGHKNSLSHLMHLLYNFGQKYDRIVKTPQYKKAISYYFQILEVDCHGLENLIDFQEKIRGFLVDVYKEDYGEIYKIHAISYLIDRWPKTANLINSDCKNTLLELVLVFTNIESRIPMELVQLMLEFIILFWPHPHFLAPVMRNSQFDI